VTTLSVGPAPAAPTLAPALADGLFRRIQAFIVLRLPDPGLTPAVIATAHHISARTLHRVFRAHQSTVSGTIRTLRLEHCRAELLDPRSVVRSVNAVGRRWGFADPAHFTRAFKGAFGMSPAAYRSRYLRLAWAASDAKKLARRVK
jgi:AraC-like DNA-binding protein